MVLVTSNSIGQGGAPQPPTFGPAVWGWALASGLALWSLGFVLLPWWAALLFWWWPSVLVGAAVGLAAISVVKLVTRATERRFGRSQSGSAEPLNETPSPHGADPPLVQSVSDASHSGG